jgi:hypothetical protein
MTKLNQIIPLEDTAKKTAELQLTAAYHLIQKDAVFNGISRTYQPDDDEGDKLPQEQTKVQNNVETILEVVANEVGRALDLVFTKEAANTQAKADLVVDGVTIAKDVPVTYLLQLEKQLVHLRSFISKLPLLDPAENWHVDGTTGVFVSDEIQTTRSKKVPRRFVKYEATDKHPAQVDVWHEDVIVGRWTTKKFSGRISQPRQAVLLERVRKLIDAVKVAREAANSIEVTDRKVGTALFGYLFGA